MRKGGKTWFFITADYAFGHALERDTAAVVKAASGAVRRPLNTADYLVEVKKPAESKGAYDYLKVLDEIPVDKAFRPLAEEKGTCGLVKTTVRPVRQNSA